MFESFLANRTVGVLWEALPRILSAGLTMTIPLTLISFSLAMVIAVAVALVQYAHVPVLSQIARFYIWVVRGTPLLVQLFIIFYGLPSVGISLIGMIKDTSLASNITVAELFMAGQRVAARTYIFLPIYCEVAVVYLLFCTVITKLQSLLERQLNARGFQ